MNNKDPRVKTLNPKIGGPLAIVLVLGFAGVFIYGYMKQSKDDKEYLANPAGGDIYYTKDKLANYSVMRAVEVKDDNVLIEKCTFTVADKKRLHDREWTFGSPGWVSKESLRKMYDENEITSVLRPPQQ
jgi:hypothetical protein